MGSESSKGQVNKNESNSSGTICADIIGEVATVEPLGVNIKGGNDSLNKQMSVLTRAVKDLNKTSTEIEIGELIKKNTELEQKVERLEKLEERVERLEVEVSKLPVHPLQSQSSLLESIQTSRLPMLESVRPRLKNTIHSRSDCFSIKSQSQVSEIGNESSFVEKEQSKSTNTFPSLILNQDVKMEGSIIYDRTLQIKLHSLCTLNKCHLCHLCDKTFNTQVQNTNFHYWCSKHFTIVEEFIDNHFKETIGLKGEYKPSILLNRPLPEVILSQCSKDKCNLCEETFAGVHDSDEHYKGIQHKRIEDKCLRNQRSPLLEEWFFKCTVR